MVLDEAIEELGRRIDIPHDHAMVASLNSRFTSQPKNTTLESPEIVDFCEQVEYAFKNNMSKLTHFNFLPVNAAWLSLHNKSNDEAIAVAVIYVTKGVTLVGHMVVREAYRRLGLGTVLLNITKRLCGKVPILLTTLDAAGDSFFRGNGFTDAVSVG